MHDALRKLRSSPRWRRGGGNEGWLGKFLEFPNGIPSHDTFLAVFCALDPGAFPGAFLLWVGGVRERAGESVVALDGKACRCTKGTPGEMLTMVPAVLVPRWKRMATSWLG